MEARSLAPTLPAAEPTEGHVRDPPLPPHSFAVRQGESEAAAKREPSSSMGISRERSRAAVDSHTRLRSPPDRMEHSPPLTLPNLSRQPSTYPPPNSTTYSGILPSHLKSTEPGSGGRGQAGGGEGQGEGDEIHPIAAGRNVPTNTRPLRAAADSTHQLSSLPVGQPEPSEPSDRLRDVTDLSRFHHFAPPPSMFSTTDMITKSSGRPIPSLSCVCVADSIVRISL
jgi:hypothetical protein